MSQEKVLSEKVLYEIDGRVAIITINRPDKLNAMDDDVFGALAALGRKAAADPDVRCVLVRGNGRAFSAGIDLATLAGGATGPDGPTVDIKALQDAFTVYETAPKPTIAAVQGHCLGAGLQLAIACDLRILADDARLAAAEVRWGILPDLGATQRLPRLIGLGRAKDMILTGRSVPADEALAWGLGTSICGAGDLAKVSLELARRLAAGPPLALAAAKRLANAAFDQPVTDGLDREANAQRTLLTTSDFREAMQAGVERRDPQFEAR